nr:putative membrane-bound O-acyltransferase C24H6.01C isoform X1 [Ipomoea batatas]
MENMILHKHSIAGIKHLQRCDNCSSGRTCYLLLQERSLQDDKFSITTYLCYLFYAPLYIAGPIISFNAFASQLDTPQKTYRLQDVVWYGFRWVFSLLLMELMTHFSYFNAFAVSGMWRYLSPMDVFIIGYGVLNFMWLKFFLIWRYFRFWSLVNGIEPPENMPRYMYIPLGGSGRKLLNVWVVFTFVAIWHDLEWKLLSWAWLTCIFFIPEMIVKSTANAFKVMLCYLNALCTVLLFKEKKSFLYVCIWNKFSVANYVILLCHAGEPIMLIRWKVLLASSSTMNSMLLLVLSPSLVLWSVFCSFIIKLKDHDIKLIHAIV